MNSTPATHSDLEIVKTIVSETDAEVSRILEAARNEAAAETARMHEEAEAEAAAILAQAAQTAARYRTREMATASVEARRMLLWAHERRVSAVLDRITKRLRVLRDTPERYKESLIGLGAEAVIATGGERVRLQFPERDRDLVDEALLRAIRAAVDARSGGGVHVDVEFVCDSIDAGCVASTPDGRIVYDNTYQRRLERQRRSLRRAIQREIEQSHE